MIQAAPAPAHDLFGMGQDLCRRLAPSPAPCLPQGQRASLRRRRSVGSAPANGIDAVKRTASIAFGSCKGHNAPKDQRFKVYVAGQKRGLTAAIKRAFRRRSAVEPTIGHLKNEHRMGRNHLAGRAGDAVNAVLAAAGYNFRLLLRWLALLLHFVLAALTRPSHASPTFAQP